MVGRALSEHADSTANTATAASPIAAGMRALATTMVARTPALEATEAADTTAALSATEAVGRMPASGLEATSAKHAIPAEAETAASVGGTACDFSLEKTAAGRGDASAGYCTTVRAAERGGPALERSKTDISGIASCKLSGATLSLAEEACGREKGHRERSTNSRCARNKNAHKYGDFAKTKRRHANSKNLYSRDSYPYASVADEDSCENDEELQLALALSTSVHEAQKQDTTDQRRKDSALTVVPKKIKAIASRVTGIAPASAGETGEVYRNNPKPSHKAGENWERQPQHNGTDATLLTSSENSQSSSTNSSEVSAGERPYITIAKLEAEQSENVSRKYIDSGTHMNLAAAKSTNADLWFATDEWNKFKALSKREVRQKKRENTPQPEQRLCRREVNERFVSMDVEDEAAAAAPETNRTQKGGRGRHQGERDSLEYVEDENASTAGNGQRWCPREMVINERPAAGAASREQQRIYMPCCASVGEAYYAEKPRHTQQFLMGAADRVNYTGPTLIPACATSCTGMKCSAAHKEASVVEAFRHRQQLQPASPQAYDVAIAKELLGAENIPANAELSCDEVRYGRAKITSISAGDGGRRTKEVDIAAAAAQRDGGPCATAEEGLKTSWPFEKEQSNILTTTTAAGRCGNRSRGRADAATSAGWDHKFRKKEAEKAAVWRETLTAAERRESQIAKMSLERFRETLSVRANAERAVTLSAIYASSSRSCEIRHNIADASRVSSNSANICYTRNARSRSSSAHRSSSDTRSTTGSGDCRRIHNTVRTLCDSLNSKYHSDLHLQSRSANVSTGRRNASEGGGQVEAQMADESGENRAGVAVPDAGLFADVPFPQDPQSDVNVIAPIGGYCGSDACSHIEEILEGASSCVSVDTGSISTQSASAANIKATKTATVIAASGELYAEEATTAGETTGYMKATHWATAGALKSEESDKNFTDMDSDFEPEKSSQSGAEYRRRSRRTQQQKIHREWFKGEGSTTEKAPAAMFRGGEGSSEGDKVSSFSPLLVDEHIEANSDKNSGIEEQASRDASLAARCRGGTKQKGEESKTRFARSGCGRREQHIDGGDYTVSGRGTRRVRSTEGQHILSEKARTGEGAPRNWKLAETKANATAVLQAGKCTKFGLTERRQIRAHRQQHRLRLRAELRLAENDAAVAAVTAWKRERLHEACIYVWAILTQAIPSPIPSKETSLGGCVVPAQNKRKRDQVTAEKARNSTVAALIQRQQEEELQQLLFTSPQQHNQQPAKQHRKQFARMGSSHFACSLQHGNLIEHDAHTSYTTPSNDSQSMIRHRPTPRTHMTLAQLDEAAATAGLADLNVEDLLKMIATAASVGAATADENYALARTRVQKSQITKLRQGSNWKSRGGIYLSSKSCSSHYRLVLGETSLAFHDFVAFFQHGLGLYLTGCSSNE